MKTIQEVDKQIDKLQRHRNKIEKIEGREHLAAMKKECVGKCFKYGNSYGNNKKRCLHIRVVKCNSVYLPNGQSKWLADVICDTFEQTCNDEFNFTNNTYCYWHRLLGGDYKPISEEEYWAERKKLVDELRGKES